jgi:DNA-directed RNA polymerase subunit beta'
MASGGDDDVYAGFDVIDQLFQVPKTFPHRASVATADGKVNRIEEAPQGGWNVYVNDEPHYVLPEVKVSVKEGDTVEAGDQISSGILNPRDVVKYKGLGEGRRYFMERATKAYKDSGYAVNRRNLEVLVRGMMDHAIINDPKGANTSLPGDVVSYNQLAFRYRPRAEAKNRDLQSSVGKYLEQPALHYTIGTRITKKVADKLGKFGHTRVMSHDEPPEFEPYMVGLRAVPQHEQDWIAQLGSSYLKANLLKQVHRGGESSTHGLHPVPGTSSSLPKP